MGFLIDTVLVIVFVWLLIKVVKLVFKAAWGVTKIVASILFGVAVPLLFLCLKIAGGALLLIPLALIGLAFGLLKKCL